MRRELAWVAAALLACLCAPCIVAREGGFRGGGGIVELMREGDELVGCVVVSRETWKMCVWEIGGVLQGRDCSAALLRVDGF